MKIINRKLSIDKIINRILQFFSSKLAVAFKSTTLIWHFQFSLFD